MVLTLVGFLCINCDSLTQTPAGASQIQTSNLDQQIRDFLQREVTAHVADIRTLDPPPDCVDGALTAGEFSWGTFSILATLSAFPRLKHLVRILSVTLSSQSCGPWHSPA
jgi:hypothetical protein